jgi:serine phosphatase RsbU (regulator of sigma subunit)
MNGCLVYRLWRPVSPSGRIRTQWAFFSLLVSVSPFVFFYKAPAAFGQAPLIPLWLAQVFLLLFPVGWAMAVTAYRMFEVEWVLSRAIVHAVSTGLVAGLLAGIAAVGVHFHSTGATYSIPLLVALGVVTAYLLLSGLIGQVRVLVDRVLYRDAYDYQKVLGDLSRELAESISEPAIAGILTDRLPRALRLTKSMCVVRSGSDYVPLLQEGGGETGTSCLRVAASDLAPDSVTAPSALFRRAPSSIRESGFPHMLSLSAADVARGFLLLGDKLSGAPFSVRDIRLLESFTAQVTISLDNLDMHRELVRTEQVRRELLAAARILRRIVPGADRIPHVEGYEITGLTKSCKEVGGDYFDVIPMPSGRLALVMFDVSGKGLEAALVVSTLQAACHVLAKTGASLCEIARQVNQVLVDNTASETFATGFVAFLDPGSGRLESVNAGHNPPYLVLAGGVLVPLVADTIPFGILPGDDFPCQAAHLVEGDRLYCYTDGVTEAMNRDEEMFGEGRLEALLRQLPPSPGRACFLDPIEAAVCAWTGKPMDDTGFPHDDFTHLSLLRLRPTV